MSDEEVYCVCYPTDFKPAFRRTDLILHFTIFFIFLFGNILMFDLRVRELFSYNSCLAPFFSFFFKKKKMRVVWSGGHLYSCAPPTQVDGDMEIIKAIWCECISSKKCVSHKSIGVTTKLLSALQQQFEFLLDVWNTAGLCGVSKVTEFNQMNAKNEVMALTLYHTFSAV